MLKTSLVALFASSLCLTACGGGDGGSGVDSSKVLTSLSDAEIIEICEYSTGLLNDQHLEEAGCYAQGVYAAAQEGDCEAVAATCIAAIVPETDAETCSDAAEDSLPSCASMVDVGEMESCLRAQASQYNGISVTCATTTEELEELFEPPTPAACAAVEAKCPDLFGSSDDA